MGNDTFLERLGDNFTDAAGYVTRYGGNLARSMTVGHNYIIKGRHLDEGLNDFQRQSLVDVSSKLLGFYSRDPEDFGAPFQSKLDGLSDVTGQAGVYTGMAAGGVGAGALVIGSSATGPVGIVGGALAGTALIAGGSAAGACVGGFTGSVIEQEINRGFPVPRRLTRDALLADINHALENGISYDDIMTELETQLESHRNTFSNGALNYERRHSSFSLINNVFVSNGVDVPTHEGHDNEFIVRDGERKSTLVATPLHFDEHYIEEPSLIPCTF